MFIWFTGADKSKLGMGGVFGTEIDGARGLFGTTKSSIMHCWFQSSSYWVVVAAAEVQVDTTLITDSWLVADFMPRSRLGKLATLHVDIVSFIKFLGKSIVFTYHKLLQVAYLAQRADPGKLLLIFSQLLES